MNRKSILVGVTALALMALCSGVLGRLKLNQHLGAPGLKVEPIPGSIRLRVLLPESVLFYESREATATESELAILPKDTSFGRRIYRGTDGYELQASVVLMGTDRTSIHKPEFCLKGQGLTIDREESVMVPVTEPTAYQLPVRKFTCTRLARTKDGREVTVRGIYAFWFVADNAVTDSHWTRQWWMGRELLRTGTLQRWAYVSYFAFAPVGREDEAWERMKALIAASVPKFQTASASGLAAAPVPARTAMPGK